MGGGSGENEIRRCNNERSEREILNAKRIEKQQDESKRNYTFVSPCLAYEYKKNRISHRFFLFWLRFFFKNEILDQN